MYKCVIYEKEGNIARITLNKPEKLNTFLGFDPKDELHLDLRSAFKEAEDDDDIKVIILKGAGRCFSAGGDLTRVGFVYGFGTGQPGERRPSQRIRLKCDRHSFMFLRTIFESPKLTLGQVHGYALEGALYWLLYCDFVIAAEDAQLGFPGQRLGFAGFGNPTFSMLMMHVGHKRALDLYVTGKLITGKEAADIGLVTKAVPLDRLETEVNKYAEALCLYPRDGIAMAKACRYQFYEQLGLTAAFSCGYVHHTMFTNIRWEPDEWNYFKQRRDKGAKVAFHEKDTRHAEVLKQDE